ncbi:MAG: hypothetical protein ABI779_25445 [Acidobacteriota bacterium]
MALTAGLAASFIGGSARASGQVPLGEGITPVQFALRGGLAAVGVFLVLGWLLYARKCDEIFSMTYAAGTSLQEIFDKFENRYDVTVKPLNCAAAVLKDPVRKGARLTVTAPTRGLWLEDLVSRVRVPQTRMAIVSGTPEKAYNLVCTTEAQPPERPPVPPTDPVPVTTLPETPREAFTLLRDITIFDLRAWRPLPTKPTGRDSPVSMLNYLHVIKRKSSESKYTIHYSTSGAGIDLRCITHKARILMTAKSREHVGSKYYAIEIDVADQKPNEEFLVVIEGTYWNGFQKMQVEDAATYTDDDISKLQELALVVLLPEYKRATSFTLESGPDGGDLEPYRGPQSSYRDPAGNFIYWSIGERKPDHHYQVRWNW